MINLMRQAAFALCLFLSPMAQAEDAAPSAPIQLDRAAEQGGYVLGWAPKGTVDLLLDGRAVPLAADGRFALGFGRDASANAQLMARLGTGETLSLTIPIAPRQWQLENLPTLPRVSQPSAEFLARRPGELAQIEAARKSISTQTGWRQPFIWPARGRISGVFGSQRIYAGEPGVPHNGVDVAGATGTPIYAPANGVVILAATSPFTLEGHLLMIDHGMGLNSAFLHLSRIDVALGDVIRQGQPIGAIGMTGRATGPHLHWGMRWLDQRIDPALVAGPMPAAPAPREKDKKPD